MKFRYYAIKLSALVVVIFFFQMLFRNQGFTEAFLLNKLAISEPWRFLTAIFLHADLIHLIYNIFALALFGSILEGFIRGKKFLITFFITGIFANFISLNFYESSLGASGAVFGVIGALIFVRPMLMVFAFGLPMPIFMAGILWIAGDLAGIFMPSDTANIAHLSGMFFGFLFGIFYRKRARKIKERGIRINEKIISKWEDRHLRQNS